MSDISFNVHSVSGDGTVQLGAESDVIAIFYKGKELDGNATRESGVPIYRDVDMVEIRQLGERDTTHQRVEMRHRQRWPQRWAAFQQNRTQEDGGTPLEILFPNSPATVATLKSFNITNVQQLAKMPDSAAGAIQFGDDMRQKAKDLLGTVEKGKEYHVLEKKLEDAEYKNLELEERLKALEAKLTKPRKSETQETV
jgi:hypothetical protein